MFPNDAFWLNWLTKQFALWGQEEMQIDTEANHSQTHEIRQKRRKQATREYHLDTDLLAIETLLFIYTVILSGLWASCTVILSRREWGAFLPFHPPLSIETDKQQWIV